jgi:LDH2 family malate/lactate/ureidoglycolate dehydrogenase
MRAVPPAPGFAEVLIPGDREARTRAERLRHGLPIPDDLWRKLCDLAASLRVPIP